MQRKLMVLATGVMLGSLLAGCTTMNQDGVRTKNRNDGYRILDRRVTDNNMNGLNGNDRVGPDRNDAVGANNMTMDEKIANKIAQMKEVDSAYVLLTDNNAYVAVTLDNNTGAGTRPKAMTGTNNWRGAGMTDRTGMNGRTGMTDRTGMNGRTGMTDRTGMNGNGMLEASELTDPLKAKISDKVRNSAPNVDNVYVSTNPDFVGRMTNYMNDVRRGRPIQGFAEEFGEMVRQIFPVNAAANNPAGTR
ncbi:YhcN/YlaJ family sporulation lipoprotein [Paenibacillus beijingensis]|uniref:YhcN/YlaJ family sporulation lipoprotein n=1 Tax=Paenibacillus beijingensis TaxID=1126833 RepID=UPI000696FF6C|nr:YhcN/YlaJ family sporulation lipoprotein [Paenibacillus beijingensis]